MAANDRATARSCPRSMMSPGYRLRGHLRGLEQRKAEECGDEGMLAKKPDDRLATTRVHSNFCEYLRNGTGSLS